MKKVFLILSLLILSSNTVFAQKIPVKIAPAENISTAYDQIELGDYLKFKVLNDVYYKNQIYIKKDTPILVKVDFLCENGWVSDNAEIDSQHFITKDINGNKVSFESNLSINGFDLLKTKGNRFAQFFNYIGAIGRGKEIDIKYGIDNPIFTIWMNK